MEAREKVRGKLELNQKIQTRARARRELENRVCVREREMGLLIASPRARASSPPGNSNGRRAIYTYKPAAAAICRVLLFCCANACNWSSEGRL